MTLYIAVAAMIPSASETIAVPANPGASLIRGYRSGGLEAESETRSHRS